MDQKHSDFLKAVSAFVPKKQIYTDSLRRLAWGTDAGFYRLVPQIVIRAYSEDEVARILALASAMGVAVTFRAAGTSLSGQTVTDSVLVVASDGWEEWSVNDDASIITLQPGITGGRANDILAARGRIFPPDPASRASAMVGGIVMNNASGMNCGTHANSDRILVSARMVLADGTVIDTADPAPASDRERQLLDTIARIRDDVRADADLCARIRRKYSIKCVTGLNLLPFVEHDDPRRILAHLLVGSEGTLAFLSRVTMRTAPLLPATASAMVYFSDMRQACLAVVDLKKNVPQVYSCEFLDKKSLASVGDTTGSGLTALLIETRAESPDALAANISAISSALSRYPLFKPVAFTSTPAEVAALWRMRSGVFPTVGGTRPKGTTSLIEDVAFHIDDLPDATVDLARLIEECGYDDACIYGHAFEGNYHFVIAQAFDSQAEVDKYRRLIDRIVSLVVDRYDGSLKAEHGTGRNMAPFVAREWGDKAFAVMRRVKEAFDPQGILNPGVIFNDDPLCYVSGFKPLTPVNDIVDKCIECGFCEVNCVSCGFTFSARQRIVTQREIARLRASGDDPGLLRRLEKDYRFPGLDTCAADGLCSLSCPMGINTGDFTHVLRAEARPAGSLAYKVGAWAAAHLGGVEASLRPLLATASLARKVIGPSGVRFAGKALHKVGLPLWTPALPVSFSPRKAVARAANEPQSDLKVVYFPSCINQTMGPSRTKGAPALAPLVDTMVALCQKAGYQVVFPEGLKGLCCGMIWESKGMPDIADSKLAALEQALLRASDGGRYPVLCDQSPCLHRMRSHITSMHLYEPAEFISLFLAPRLRFSPVTDTVAVHVTCSTRLMGLADTIVGLARRCAADVLVPEGVGCCGFAGDKGFTHPELNQWALRRLRAQIAGAGATEGFSNSRTCEIGLTTASGIPYQSIAYLVDRATSPLGEQASGLR